MKSWKIHIKGIVQGVGFRPFVYRLAQDLKLCGKVSNEADGVHIIINADQQMVQAFCDRIRQNAPSGATIATIKYQEIPYQTFDAFRIVQEASDAEINISITPDFALCDDCRSDIHDLENRRHHYAFTTCTNCGPRYAILERIPYDRESTSMEDFQMCTECHSEYRDIKSRRFYSQTNSCGSCGISLQFCDSNGIASSTSTEDIYRAVINAWDQGKIVAIKNQSGYLLTCDASQNETVERLRTLKQRPSKPFAVLFPNLKSLKEILLTTPKEEELLTGRVAPIVLLPLKNKTTKWSLVAPKQAKLGAMLPNSALLEILMHQYGKGIVATSANRSGSPIIYDEQKDLGLLTELSDLVLSHNLKIVSPQDDSVVCFTKKTGQKIVIRRGRGLAPSADLGTIDSKEDSLAVGGMLKSTLTYVQNGRIYMSQYLGDSSNFDVYQQVLDQEKHLSSLLKFKANNVLCDAHPQYPTTIWGQEKAIREQIVCQEISHHEAHFAAILGEHDLINGSEEILGVIWDGAGYGTSSNIYGGEFYRYQDHQITHLCQLKPFPLILGDKMAKEPRISALSLVNDTKEELDLVLSKFASIEQQIYLKKRVSPPLMTSSMGRLFDAISSILGFMDVQTYEGEAAMLVERSATTYFDHHGYDFVSSYWSSNDSNEIDASSWVKQICLDKLAGINTDKIAAKFHNTLVRCISFIAQSNRLQHIACSGGVFQNALLVDLIKWRLGGDFTLYFHNVLPPNDENISYGQIMHSYMKTQKKTFNTKNKMTCV